ncbi:CG13185 [Drosophila busckii]|uniref:Midasin n=1 Tax=Drosophila busckii TaxID=30019 RepID=A0A0M4EB88_DROBS|nr:midasin [Drosophila busckii]ALC40740.1 CG13185 [Drosophila busckii]
MDVNINKLRRSAQQLLQLTASEPQDDNFLLHVQKFIKKQHYVAKDVECLFETLSQQLTVPAYTLPLAISFREQLLLLLSMSLRCNVAEQAHQYELECVALAKLLQLSVDAQRFAKCYFRQKPAPFAQQQSAAQVPVKKSKKTKNVGTNLPLIKCCYQLLKCDVAYYRELWDWSSFLERYAPQQTQACQLTQLYCNEVMALLSDMSATQLHTFNREISVSVRLQFEAEQQQLLLLQQTSCTYLPDLKEQMLTVQLTQSKQAVTNMEGVLLPVYNQENQEFYAHSDGCYDRIVKVDSTMVNLRSIALGVAAAKPICLSGPVGCGKTTLIEYLARKTGRICPKPKEREAHAAALQKAAEEEQLLKPKKKSKIAKATANKRKLNDVPLEQLLDLESESQLSRQNGFLRIQLGDQTDSKMLLGQYRCTDVPGEFIWLPGVLTQAVMHGYWLLLEDLDAATQDTYTILSSLLERNYLSVPGFRDCVKIEPGFQLFVTVRTNKSASNSNRKSLYALLEKYLYTINILPLSRNELCKVVSSNYPKLATVANRIVDVFLTFSSGDHAAADNLRQQESNDKADNTEKYVALPFEQLAPGSLPHSGRLVSTRDLIKLCQRASAQFSVTSAECAYFVFQHAVDVFCAYMPKTKEQTALITSIGAKLGIIRSRCEHYANDYKPESEFGAQHFRIGRATLPTKPEEEEEPQQELQLEQSAAKRQKLSKLTRKSMSQANAKRVTFSFTRLASCILERIAVCVHHAEPVLLVGETGVGKTSAVQYLAARTEHKLVAINMNNQSDVSDLVGGFKPVELNYVLAPLRYEFEHLFNETFNAAKNAQFLQNFATHFNNGRHMVIIRSMLHVCAGLLQKPEHQCSPVLPRWQTLREKLQRLQSQLEKSINISFAFIPGSLVQCISNGDWVLLDEINLATAETLECLCTILEPAGSVVLLERGDFMPVKRHPDFRIFACMNPNTDIGKKDLPVGIRNRFSEFFVDELTTDADLSLLVGDYLANTGIQRKAVHNIVQLYKNLRRLAELQLNDGLGNRPVYSLRTLCRSLRICARNLCGSIERNLYESFCLSFLTQLDTESHQLVLLLIRDALLSNPKAVLNQALPQLGEKYLQFEGYWIQQGELEPQACEHYILTASVRNNLQDLARIISIGQLPILLQGPTSAGKTSLIDYVARRSGNRCLRINNHEHTDLQEYIGSYAADATGKLTFREGVLVQAMRQGHWIILDELNLASTDILEALNRVLDDNRELYIAETQTLVKAHANFMLFATQNPPGLYGGRKTLSRAFKNRFIELHFADIPRAELEVILEQRCRIPASYARKMVQCMGQLQQQRKHSAKQLFTLRDLFRWGNRYTYADAALQQIEQYDWNQHLVEEGYLVLSAKVRTPEELQLIEQTLYKNFRKRLDLQLLFDVHSEQQSSAVSSSILKAIREYAPGGDLVWTRNMTRMAVLTAKALQFDEPVLLVGPTGCGKTSVCQLLAQIASKQLRILNCHMHTEGADFLGGLRPCRGEQQQQRLFEWADGPLVYAMLEGSYFMADEISLAEDSVLERLNCILEPERSVLLAEKGGLHSDEDFVVQAQAGFQFLATMNPGGDFGKKELSPALRNRFTEIWCLPSDEREDLIAIAHNCMSRAQLSYSKDTQAIAAYMVDIVLYIRQCLDKFKFSVRDILAWANYMLNNAQLSFAAQAIFGLETIFLDALEMLPHETEQQLAQLRARIIDYAIKQAALQLNEQFDAAQVQQQRGQQLRLDSQHFGLAPFFIEVNAAGLSVERSQFLFDAPTSKQNLFRLLSALTLQKPVLLEGPPGVGKTSIVESMAQAIGYKLVRINLCEHTDLADLFGTDLPAEDNLLERVQSQSQLGSFVWRDGPLLAALKSEHTWILLDELNLAPQSVLEGLNAVLDHRGEVYIPELNRSFQLTRSTRIFACQNPLKQGGGRKGLPQSFLNRFNKVYLRSLSTEDLLHVVNSKFGAYFEQLQQYFVQLPESCSTVNLFELHAKRPELSAEFESFDLAARLVRFSQQLEQGVASMQFGYKGGPFEFNLRDILRWCELLQHEATGFIPGPTSLNFHVAFNNFLLTLYERMQLVYYQRMRCTSDKLYIRQAFAQVFSCQAEQLQQLAEDVSLYWTADNVYLNDVVLPRVSLQQQQLQQQQSSPLLLATQRQQLKHIVETVHMEKPLLLCGATDSGKTKLIDALCVLSNQVCNTDTIDDSVTGSFQQIDLNRHLEQIYKQAELLIFGVAQQTFLTQHAPQFVQQLWHAWSKYNQLARLSTNLQQHTVAQELKLFEQRLSALANIITQLQQLPEECCTDACAQLPQLEAKLLLLQAYIKSADSLNTGGSFEWVDSNIVSALKSGQYVLLEHVNLCSAAVLDRLNPVFEPNGSLLIAEKGMGTQAQGVELVRQAPGFRAFLTIDPKHGELSRAMRNRCVELSLSDAEYSVDDMRALLHEQGVLQLSAIDCLLQIHEHIRGLSELHAHSISQLLQCAALSVGYRRIGYEWQRAIYVAAMEVYVYAASVDLLGFGLAYYQNKLRELVLQHTQNFEEQQQQLDLSAVVLRTNELNELTLIKLQAAPLTALLQAVHEVPQQLLTQLCQGMAELQLAELNLPQLLRYFVYMLYESCSQQDLQLRQLYMQQLLHAQPELLSLSQQLYTYLQQQLQSDDLSDLPWQRLLLPRLRDYALQPATAAAQQRCLSLSASLWTRLLLGNLPQPLANQKLATMSLLDYSQALPLGKVSDKHSNVFLLHLAELLQQLLHLLQHDLAACHLTLEAYAQLFTQLLWFNRLLLVAQQPLLLHNEFNVQLQHTLLLHFRWLQKHLLKALQPHWPQLLQTHPQLSECLQQMQVYVQHSKPPTNQSSKLYAKNFTLFQPNYLEEQITLHEQLAQLEKLLQLVPQYGNMERQLWQQKWLALHSDAAHKWRAYQRQNSAALKLGKFELPTAVSSKELLELLQQLQLQLKQAEQPMEMEMQLKLDLNEIKEKLAEPKAEDAEQQQQPELRSYQLLLPALREYFMQRVVSASLQQPQQQVNELYSEQLLTLNAPLWQCLNTLQHSGHERIMTACHMLQAEPELQQLSGSSCYKTLRSYERQYRAAWQAYQLDNLAVRLDCAQLPQTAALELSCVYSYQGAALTNTLLSLLCQGNGQLRRVPLGELQEWTQSLQQSRQLLWQNAALLCGKHSLQHNAKECLQRSGKQLLRELQLIGVPQTQQTMVQALEQVLQAESAQELQQCFDAALGHMLLGCLELQLLCQAPLIDPVEKQRLRQLYLSEDITNLQHLLSVYEFMQLMLHYKHYGHDIYAQLQQQRSALLQQQQQQQQQLALRPAEAHTYNQLATQLRHFLLSNCQSAQLWQLCVAVQQHWQHFTATEAATEAQRVSCLELLQKLQLWLANAQRFQQHTLATYEAYFQDLLQPVKCALQQLRFGLEQLKTVFTRVLQAGSVQQAQAVQSELVQLLAYPTLQEFKLQKQQLQQLLMPLPHADAAYYELLLSKLNELHLFIASSGTQLNEANFSAYDEALSLCQQSWQQQQQRKQQQQAEEESLYKTKTLGGVESEEQMELRELQQYFPTQLEGDFAEFLDEQLLQQLRERRQQLQNAKTADLMNEVQYAELVRNFLQLMLQHSEVYYEQSAQQQQQQLEWLSPYATRLQLFVQLQQHYKQALGEQLDEQLYNALALSLNMQQQQLQLDAATCAVYDYYKDANIAEASGCLGVLQRIEQRVLEQLALYPEHAGLADIRVIIQRIRKLPANASLVRYNTGCQLLRQKVSLWNELAHSQNNLQAEELELASFVQRWTKLELQHWRSCLQQVAKQCQQHAYRYWFYIYELLQAPALDVPQTVKSLRQFVETANFGDFELRLQLLHAFELYLHNKQRLDSAAAAQSAALIAALHNLQAYFAQFRLELQALTKTRRAPLEKKLREFVKIQSYNKDLSYFSMRHNVASVHRQLHKFLKEYRLQLELPITELLQPKDATVKDYSMLQPAKRAYSLADALFMLAPQGYLPLLQVPQTLPLLQRLGKHFHTARQLVQQTLASCNYNQLIEALQQLLHAQLERCHTLRSLQVERSKPRPQQLLQAKQILQQKRKALTDLFKLLAKLGVSYRSGLLELSLRSDLAHLQQTPCCLASLQPPLPHAAAATTAASSELYYMKCVFKLQLLQQIMLTPLSELGPPNIERLKGNAVDLFLQVQQQRQELCEASKQSYELRGALQQLQQVAVLHADEQSPRSYACHSERLQQLQQQLSQLQYVLQQWQLLLNCAPATAATITADNALLHAITLPLPQLQSTSSQLLASVQQLLLQLQQQRQVAFLSHKQLQQYEQRFATHVQQLQQLLQLLSLPQGEYMPLAQPLLQLLQALQVSAPSSNSLAEPVDLQQVELELGNIAHLTLLALQKIYKQHSATAATDAATAPQEDEDADDIKEQHLKQHLSQQLSSDWQQLQLPQLLHKLTHVLLLLQHAEPSVQHSLCLRRAAALLPILQQYRLLSDYLLLQQLGTHSMCSKMLCIMLTAFVEIGSKGFCVPPDLMQDEQQEKQDSKQGEGFGLEDGTGDQDASDKIESEDQLDDAKRPEDRQDEGEKEQPDCKEEKGIELSEDFEGKMQDLDKPEDDDSAESEEEDEELNKEMGETEEGADKLDEQIWGDDEEQPEEQEEPELNEEDQGKGSKDEKDDHNDLDTKNDAAKEDGKDEHEKDGLDATNEQSNDKDKRKEQAQDIDDMKDQEQDEEQTNAMHNELEEPPEPEEMDLGEMNMDEGHDNEREEGNEENPFDIDAMKEQMQPAEEQEDETDEQPGEEDKDKDKGDDSADSESEAEDAGTEQNLKENGEAEEEETKPEDEEEADTQRRGDLDKEAEPESEETAAEPREEKPEQHAQSKDKSSKEENVQSVPNTEQNSSADQVQQEQEEDVKQEQKLDEQETGEEKDGVGQAENDTNDGGHQGIAETKETVTQEERKNEKQTQEKRKQGRTNEERTLGEAEQHKLKQLKTIEQLKQQADNDKEEQQQEQPTPDAEAEEYQHVKEPKNSDKTTLDNATEEQSKQIQHQEEEQAKDEQNAEADAAEELQDNEEAPAQEQTELEQMSAEKTEQKSDKPSKTEQAKTERLETPQEMEIEGELITTMTVPRSAETTAHSNTELLLDQSTQAQELSTAEELQLRQLYQQQLSGAKGSLPQHEDYESWASISHRMTQNARELCEQLRLILEPTKCTRLKGDYRTGRRINMKKIIPYIASQFRKDKIWLRRTKPAQRDYKITIAIDDSKSMHHNNSKTLTLEAISLVSQALTLLESGRLSIVSFGEAPQLILNHTEQFDGPRLVSGLNFAQDKTKIAGLLDFIRTVNTEESGLAGDNSLFENLLLILSDGRNIFSEGNQKVKNAIKLARLQRIFLVYIIIDNPENKNSILDVQHVEVNADGSVKINNYLDSFPFPYYVIVRDLNQLPLVLSEAMRQWFELVNSEQ